MRKALLVIAVAIGAAAAAAGQAVPAELARLAEKAQLSGPVTAWPDLACYSRWQYSPSARGFVQVGSSTT